MFKILEKEIFSPRIKMFKVQAPQIADKALAGHFVMIRLHDKGERIPLTIADSDKKNGTITIIFQEAGKTTCEMGTYEAGDVILDILGPLGTPYEVKKLGTVVCVSGGVGLASMYPKTKALYEAGNKVISLIGAQKKELLFFQDEAAAVSHEIAYSTDDGSFGHKGFVTELLQGVIDRGHEIHEVVTVGPLPMMRAVCEVTRPYKIKTIVSLNPIMVDGSGMCGSCRVTVGGEVKFACVDGPAFDGHLVDFAELMDRQKRFLNEEQVALEGFRHEGGTCKCQRR